MLGVLAGVQEADPDRLDAFGLQELELGARGLLVEREQHVAVLAHALGDLAPQPALDDRARLVWALPRGVVQVHVEGPPDATVVDRVAVALRDEHAGAGPGPGQRGVEADGVAMVERRQLLRLSHEPAQRAERSLGLVAGGRQHLGPGDQAGLVVDHDGVGERAADVNSNSDCHRTLSSTTFGRKLLLCLSYSPGSYQARLKTAAGGRRSSP